MSALALQKVTAGTLGSYDACMDPNCNRKGRYTVQIAGYLLASESRLAEHHAARLCLQHANAWKSLWAEMSGAADLKRAEDALAALRGSEAERVEAIFALRELGLSKEEIVRALAWIGEGLSVEQVLEGLVGGEVGECREVAA